MHIATARETDRDATTRDHHDSCYVAPAAKSVAMDDYMFRYYVDECRVVKEDTHYLEIFNYSVRTHAPIERNCPASRC